MPIRRHANIIPLAGSHLFFCCSLGGCAGSWATALCYYYYFFFLCSLCWSVFPILCSTNVSSSSSDSASYTALENCCLFILALSNVLHNLKALRYFLHYLTPGSQHPFILSKTSWENMFWFPLSPPATLKPLLSCMLLINLIPWGTWFNNGQIKGIVKGKLPYTL